MIEEAVRLAKSNNTDLNKMAAIIAKRKTVLGVGLNSRKSHPMQYVFSKSHFKIALHAEVSAIVDALRTNDKEELRGATIYVARVLKDGSRARAKPCATCQRALDAYGIDAVYWTEYES